MPTPDLNAIAVFTAVADARSFRAAAERLGVTRSAVSQTIQRLEASLGAALLQRTSRSVAMTEAGERLYERAAPAVADVLAATQAVLDSSGSPRGLLKLAVSSIAERFIDGPLLASFAAAHPEVDLDVTITDEEFDIVERGYDAGVRLGEVLEQDMIAVPVSGDQRQMVVGTELYLQSAGRPSHPRDLVDHVCIGWRRSPDVAPYRWEFTEDGRDFSVEVEPRITTNDMWLMLRTALADGGLTFGMAETFARYVTSGRLVPVLEEFCPPFPGFFLYYPSRRNAAPKLRAFVDHSRRFMRQTEAGSPTASQTSRRRGA